MALNAAQIIQQYEEEKKKKRQEVAASESAYVKTNRASDIIGQYEQEKSSSKKTTSTPTSAPEPKKPGFFEQVGNKVKSIFNKPQQPQQPTDKKYPQPAPAPTPIMNQPQQPATKQLPDDGYNNMTIDVLKAYKDTEAQILKTRELLRVKQQNKSIPEKMLAGVFGTDTPAVSPFNPLQVAGKAFQLVDSAVGITDEAKLAQQLERLEKANMIYKEHLGMEETNRGFLKGLWNVLKNPVDAIIPFVSDTKSVDLAIEQYDALKKYQAGADLTDQEFSAVQSFMADAVNQTIDRGLGYQVGQVVGNMPSFVLAFAATAGVGAVGSKVAAKGMSKVAAPAIVKSLVSGSVGAIAQTSVFVPTIANNTAQYMIPQIKYVEGKQGDQLIADLDKGDGFAKAATKGYLSTLIEIATERAGSVIEDGLPFIKKAILGKYAEKIGLPMSKEFNKLARAAGWNGIFGEVFEEELGEVFRAPLEERDYKPVWTPEGAERLLVETLGIAAFGGIARIPDLTLQTLQKVRAKRGEKPFEIPVRDVPMNVKEEDDDNTPSGKPFEIPAWMVQKSNRYQTGSDLAEAEYGAKGSDKFGLVNPNEVTPANETDQAGVDKYKQLIEAGKDNEPIEVTIQDGKLVATDGSHHLVAYQQLGKQAPVILRGEGEYKGLISFDEIYNQSKQLSQMNRKQNEANSKRYVEATLAGKNEAKRMTGDDVVTMFRATDKDGIQAGDYVTLDKAMAEKYVAQREGAKLVTLQGKMSDLVASDGIKGEYVYAPRQATYPKPVSNEEGVDGSREKVDGGTQKVEDSPKKDVNETPTKVDKSKEDVNKPEGQVYDYSSTQLNLPNDVASDFKTFQKRIHESELMIDEKEGLTGYEDNPHITVKYGLETSDVNDLYFVAKQAPITVTMGKVSMFDNPDYDVLKVEVSGDQLVELNKLISSKLKNTDTFPTYEPHATIAYLKKGEGKKYVGDTSFEGKQITISELMFSSKTGQLIPVKLEGKAEAPKEPPTQKPVEPTAKKTQLESALEKVGKKIYENGEHVIVASNDGMTIWMFENGNYRVGSNYQNLEREIGFIEAKTGKKGTLTDDRPAKIKAIYDLMNDDQKFGISVGMFPVEIMEKAEKAGVSAVDLMRYHEHLTKKSIIGGKDEQKTDIQPTGSGTGNERVSGTVQPVESEPRVAGGTGEVDSGSVARGKSGERYGGVRDGSGKISRKEQVSINEQIRALVAEKGNKPSMYTQEEKELLRKYTGAGGLDVGGRGALDEYYTPTPIVETMWNLVSRYNQSKAEKLNILEPSVGIGNFLEYAPKNSKVVGLEIDKTSAIIAQVLHPTAYIANTPFEEYFIDRHGKKRETPANADIVIGNPPYGEHRGMYLGLGEEKNIKKYEEYFIKRGLDKLRDGGVLVMVIPSSWLRGGMTKGKEAIAKMGRLEVAYRLPNGVFGTTDIGTDIVVFRKGGTMDPVIISNDRYFEVAPLNILGMVSKGTGQYGADEVKGTLQEALKLIPSMVRTPRSESESSDVNQPNGDKTNNVSETPTARSTKTKGTVKATHREVVRRGKIADQDKDLGLVRDKWRVTRKVKKDQSKLLHDPKSYDPVVIEGFKNTTRDGSLSEEFVAKLTAGQKQQFTSYYKGKLYLDFNYVQGNIYEKLEQLERDRKDMTDAQYTKQKADLERVKPKAVTLDQIKLSAKAPLANMIRIIMVDKNGQRYETSLKEAFKAFVKTLDHQAFGGLTFWDIVNYVDGIAVTGNDKERNAMVRRLRPEIANNLFKQFLGIIGDYDVDNTKKVETAFNQTLNAHYYPDYSRVPLLSRVYQKFKGGKELTLNKAQKNGIGFLISKGLGGLGWDVGVGKTMGDIIAVNEVIQRGWAKRPVIVVGENVHKQWIREIHRVIPGVTVNDLGNLGGNFKGTIDELKKEGIQEGSITILTIEGFKRLGFTDQTYDELQSELTEITDNADERKTKRQQAKDAEKIGETVGKSRAGTTDSLTFEDLGFDHLSFDEVHLFNKIIAKAKNKKADLEDAEFGRKQANEYGSLTLTPSAQGIKAFTAAMYIQKKFNNRNVFWMSATPFTNNPLEYYSILSLTARGELRDRGLYNVNDFIDTFLDITDGLEFTANGELKLKQQIRGFNNYDQLMSMLQGSIDFVDGEDAGVVRPEKVGVNHQLRQSQLQESVYEKINQEMANLRGGRDDAGKRLSLLSKSVQTAFTPYATSLAGEFNPSYKDFVENSPKIKATMELIRQTKKDNPNIGHVVYMPFVKSNSTGLDYYDKVTEYLIKELGYKPSEIAQIRGDVSATERDRVQNDFNKGYIKVLLGSASITTGMDLQKNSTEMYLTMLPWNFTDLRQLAGRIWRQGNAFTKVRIHQMLLENSSDIFVSQKLANKEARYKSLITRAATTDNYMETGMIAYDEIKQALATDPVSAVKAEQFIETEKLNREIRGLEGQAAFLKRKLKLEDFETIESQIARVESNIKMYSQYTGEYWKKEVASYELQLAELQKKYEKMRADRIKAGVDISQLDGVRESINQKKAALEQLNTTSKEKLAAAEQEKLTAVYVPNDWQALRDEVKTANDGFWVKQASKKVVEESEEEYNQRMMAEVKQDLAQEERGKYSPSQLKLINQFKLLASNRKATEGDIQTMRAMNGATVEKAIEAVREIEGDQLSDEEAARIALDMPTKAEAEGDFAFASKEDKQTTDTAARSPEELKKRIDQLNKLGQLHAILRRTGKLTNRNAVGQFVRNAKGKQAVAPEGEVRMNAKYIASALHYIEVLSHELGHALEFMITGTTNEKTFEVFGKLTDEERTTIKKELIEVTRSIVPEAELAKHPRYYMKPTELFARFIQKMFDTRGDLMDMAPTAYEKFEMQQISQPLIREYLEAVEDAIDDGQSKFVFLPDLRETYQKYLGKRVGNIAYDEEISFRAMQALARKKIEELITEKFKKVKDDPALLFRVAEAITVTRNNRPQFGTRDFINPKNEAEAQKLYQDGWEPVVENGVLVTDEVDGKDLPRMFRQRYSAEAGEKMYNELSDGGKQLINDFTAAREEAKDYFNREMIKEVHKINSNIEGWVHHYFEGTPQDFGKGKKLQKKVASAKKHRTGVEGYVEDFRLAMTKAMTELESARFYNDFIRRQFARVTKPIPEGESPDAGWIEVVGDINTGVGTKREKQEVVIKDGRRFIPKKSRYQMPKPIYRRYQLWKGLVDEMSTTARVISSINRYWQINMLAHLGTAGTNAISGGLQFAGKMVRDFYVETFTGNFKYKQTRKNTLAMLTVLTPKGWANAPDWVWGGDQSNYYGQFQTQGIADKAIDKFANTTLRVFSLYERYWKKVIAMSESVDDLNKLGEMTKTGLRLPTTEERELLAEINTEVDAWAYDYDNIPVWLEEHKKSVVGSAVKPFATYPYKYMKMITGMIAKAFDRTEPWQGRLASILALATMMGLYAAYSDRRKKKQQTPEGTAETPARLSPRGKLYIGTDKNGMEMFVRTAKYPFLNVTDAAIAISRKEWGAAADIMNDQLGSIGFMGAIGALIIGGYRNKYQIYEPDEVIVGENLSTLIPLSRVLGDISRMMDPFRRKQETFGQTFTQYIPTTSADLQQKLHGNPRVEKVPIEGKIRNNNGVFSKRTTNDVVLKNYWQDILLSALTGIYINRVDPEAAKAYQIRAEKNRKEREEKAKKESSKKLF